MIAISTAWNAKRHDSARAIFDELKGLGYLHFEVNVHFTEQMVDETERMVNAGEIDVISVHNYCPVPPGIERAQGGGDLFHVSSEDTVVRAKAIEYGTKTIETAARLGAKLVVAHWGTVEIPSAKEVQKQALELLREHDREGLAVLYDLNAAREHLKAHYVERALESFVKLASVARDHGIKLGVENRNYFHEIPSLDEIGLFLEAAPDVAGYWHDVGHAEILEYLELYPENAFRDRWADRAVAVHVHDVKEGVDHLALGDGDVDFAAELAPFPATAPRIVETHYASADQIRDMRVDLEEIGS